MITEGATSYVPQTGRALQSEEVAPPGLPYGSGGQAATFVCSPWNLQGAERVGAEAPGKEAGREREAAEEARRQAEAAGADPEGLYTPEAAEWLAEHLKNTVSSPDTSLLEPYEEGRGAFGLEIYMENIVYQEKFEHELRGCASTVKGFVKHGWSHVGACYVSYLDPTRHELYDIVGDFTWIFRTHIQQCTFAATGIYNYVYACPQTPKYYYKLPRFPSAGAA